MPLVTITLSDTHSQAFIRDVSLGIRQSLVETFEVPKDDFFQIINQVPQDRFLYDRRYLGIERSDNLVIIQITANNTRTIEQKKALYARISQGLAEKPGMRTEDIMIILTEVAKENWSFGNGEAQYA